MKKEIIVSIISVAIALIFVQCKQAKKVISSNDNLQLVWSDEFDQDGLPNPSKWTYDVGTACNQPAGCGWGNNELQYYTENRLENAKVKDGKLIITAIKEPYKEDRSYTSARLVSKNKGDWKYGKIEIRAKLPNGKGTWPAIWMLSTDWSYGGWPESGEIDIMEHVGYAPDTIFGTVHTKAYNHLNGTQKGGEIYMPKSEHQFQTYVLDWQEDHMDWYIDGQKYFTFKNDKTDFKAWPFDQKFHMILNLAVGGNWGGKHGIDDSIWPQQMVVDYVRVYQDRTIAD